MTKPQPTDYAPYHTFSAFDDGITAYPNGPYKNPYQGVDAQAWDRGMEYAMRVAQYSRYRICHNANRGTNGHECGKSATWLGTHRRTGFTSGYCDDCKEYGDEAQYCDEWIKLD